MIEEAAISPKPLSYKNFRYMAAGRAVTTVGTGIAPVALAFAILDMTGSPTMLGIVVGARSLANAGMMLLGGVLADRLPRAMLLQGSSYAAAVSQALVAACLVVGESTLPLIVILSVLNGIFSAISMPATSALVGQTVPKLALRPANAVFRMFTNGALVIGSALGGVISASIGSSWGIGIDALSFALAGLLFSKVRVDASAKTTGKRSAFRDLRQGWSEFISHRWLWIVVLQSTVWQVVWAGSIQVLGPAVADENIGRAAWGAVLATQAMGTIVGGIVALRWRPSRGLAVGVAMTGLSAVLPLALALSPVLIILIPAAFVVGVSMEQIGVAGATAMQENIPAERLARVFSYQILGSTAAVPLGQMLAGPMASHYGNDRVMLFAGAAIILAMVGSVSSRSVRQLKGND